jgi:hypothetical protein
MAGFTQAQLDAIEKAYASGVLVVEYEGQRTTYRSLNEMERIMSKIRLALSGGAAERVSVASFR